MTNNANEELNADGGLSSTRRTFVGAMVGGGVLAAAALESMPAQAELPDLRRPNGIPPKGAMDCRFPIAYETSVPTALNLVLQYYFATARRDVGGITRTLHFPYAAYETVEPTVFQTPAEFIAKPPGSVDPSGKGDSQIGSGMYDMLDNIQIQTFNPVIVTVELLFSRYAPDGRKLGQYQSLHGVSNNDGQWAIQMSSTIFVPTDQTNVTYRDAVEAALRIERDWMLGYSVHQKEILAMRHGIDGRKTASISGPNPVAYLHTMQSGDVMGPYAAKGIKSRLVVNTTRMQPGVNETAADPFSMNLLYTAAGGAVGDYGYTLVLPQARVLHASPDRAHALGGYVRYTRDNRLISETRSIAILTYDAIGRRWADSGSFGATFYHDYSNDRRA